MLRDQRQGHYAQVPVPKKKSIWHRLKSQGFLGHRWETGQKKNQAKNYEPTIIKRIHSLFLNHWQNLSRLKSVICHWKKNCAFALQENSGQRLEGSFLFFESNPLHRAWTWEGCVIRRSVNKFTLSGSDIHSISDKPGNKAVRELAEPDGGASACRHVFSWDFSTKKRTCWGSLNKTRISWNWSLKDTYCT